MVKLWHIGLAALALLLSLVASAHAVLYKRDSRAAIAWVGFVWLVPLGGALLYFVFGINRLRRRALFLRADLERYRAQIAAAHCAPDELCQHLPGNCEHLQTLARVVETVVKDPLLPGNRLEPLLNGDQAYPAMIAAINQAKRTISLETYIFDRDEAGLTFAKALGDAVQRGVEVRVLVDAAGLRYSFPTIRRSLNERGVRCARFLPSLAPWHAMTLNLRTHRKLLIVDGRVGFTGGMNIRAGHCVARKPKNPVMDTHFRVEGPVVKQLQETFVEDWLFTTGESLRGDAWFPQQESCGEVFARGIDVGPDEDYEKLRWTLLGALSIARRSIRLATPYFLPDQPLISALNLAAMRGVEVDILLPARGNLPAVQWATSAMLWQVLGHGCRVWLMPPPFDHSKLMVVDACWALLGSANWDARSLRLNFEFNLECYDTEFAGTVERILLAKRAASRQLSLQEVDSRRLPVRLRDGLARLLSPYL